MPVRGLVAGRGADNGLRPKASRCRASPRGGRRPLTETGGGVTTPPEGLVGRVTPSAVSANEPERQLTLREAATLLAASRSRLEQLLEQGEIPFTGIDSRRRVRSAPLVRSALTRHVKHGPQAPVSPLHDSPMARRHGRHGEFWSCHRPRPTGSRLNLRPGPRGQLRPPAAREPSSLPRRPPWTKLSPVGTEDDP
jgi:excisionase family DNA binding protein